MTRQHGALASGLFPPALDSDPNVSLIALREARDAQELQRRKLEDRQLDTCITAGAAVPEYVAQETAGSSHLG